MKFDQCQMKQLCQRQRTFPGSCLEADISHRGSGCSLIKDYDVTRRLLSLAGHESNANIESMNTNSLSHVLKMALTPLLFF